MTVDKSEPRESVLVVDRSRVPGIRCTFIVGNTVGFRLQCNKEVDESFLRAPCSWRKRQCISSRGHEVDERSRLCQGSQLGAVYAD